jgi:hypothetical protein
MTVTQGDITPAMRAILVDWLVEFADDFNFPADTLHLAVSYVDRFFSGLVRLFPTQPESSPDLRLTAGFRLAQVESQSYLLTCSVKPSRYCTPPDSPAPPLPETPCSAGF